MKNLVNRLAFMIYEFLCRTMFVYNIKKSKSKAAYHQNGYNQLAAINGAMIILFTDSIILVEFICNLINIKLKFIPHILIISAFISIYFVFLFLYKDSYFEKKFITIETAMPISRRFYHYLICTFLFIILPAILALSFLKI